MSRALAGYLAAVALVLMAPLAAASIPSPAPLPQPIDAPYLEALAAEQAMPVYGDSSSFRTRSLPSEDSSARPERSAHLDEEPLGRADLRDAYWRERSRNVAEGAIEACSSGTETCVGYLYMARYKYDAWGVFRDDVADAQGFGLANPVNQALVNRSTYTGKYYDREANLFYFNARYYDPDTGRFISQDGFDYGDTSNPPSLHLYYYALANPLRYIDPDGHDWEETGGRNPNLPPGYATTPEEFGERERAATQEADLPGARKAAEESERLDASKSLQIVEESRRTIQKLDEAKEDPDAAKGWKERFAKAAGESAEALAREMFGVDDPRRLSPQQQQVIALLRESAELRSGNAMDDEKLARIYQIDKKLGELGAEGLGKGTEFATEKGIEAGETYVAGAALGLPAKIVRKSPLDEAAKGPYRPVGGHHVHAKAAFRGLTSYDPKKGFSLSQEYMRQQGWRHEVMTSTQQRLFKQLAASGRSNTLKEHTRIAVESLKAAGATEQQARKLVSESLRNLREQGVRAPSRIPWVDK